LLHIPHGTGDLAEVFDIRAAARK